MNFLQFIFSLLCLISVDVFLGLFTFIFYQYFNDKYNSKLDVVALREENNYLKNENKKVNGSVTFWDDEK